MRLPRCRRRSSCQPFAPPFRGDIFDRALEYLRLDVTHRMPSRISTASARRCNPSAPQVALVDGLNRQQLENDGFWVIVVEEAIVHQQQLVDFAVAVRSPDHFGVWPMSSARGPAPRCVTEAEISRPQPAERTRGLGAAAHGYFGHWRIASADRVSAALNRFRFASPQTAIGG